MVIASVREHVKFPLVGEHNVLNALAAVSVGVARGMKSPTRSQRWTLSPADKRGQVLKLGNITVINDCYNSNPKALKAMIDALAAMRAGAGSWWREKCWNSGRQAEDAPGGWPPSGRKED